jgi:uncharacterized protein (TIGR02145 family)
MKKKIRILTFTVALITVLGVFFSSCKKDETDPLVATSIELVSGGSQTAIIETALTNPVIVIVKDQNGNAFKGATVAFAVAEGSVSAATGTTDAEGKATVNWTLGTTVGTQTLTVTGFKADGTTALTGSPISVTATGSPLAATSIELVSGNNQTGNIVTALTNPVVVLVKDQNGDAFAGTEVSFTVTEGSVSNPTVTTGANGQASVTWTLGTTVGTQTLNATVTGLTGSPVAFSATGTQITVTDYDNNTYDAVIIGNQVWMAENLKVTHYPNGDAIPLVTDNTAWGNLGNNDTDDAYSYYDNSSANATTYGALYTYAAATGDNWARDNTANQGVCPDGWHLPTDAEWTTLGTYLGTNAGSKLAGNESLWQDGDLDQSADFGTSGFSALPGGYRYDNNGMFYNVGVRGAWWSATGHNSSGAYDRDLYYDISDMLRFGRTKSDGVSIRCVRD